MMGPREEPTPHAIHALLSEHFVGTDPFMFAEALVRVAALAVNLEGVVFGPTS